MIRRLYLPPRDHLRLATNDERIVSLADRLWEVAKEPIGETPFDPREISVSFTTRPGPAGGSLLEKEIIWTLGKEEYEVAIGDSFFARVRLREAVVEGHVSEGLLVRDPALVARYLEAASAVPFGRRSHTVLHAGAVVGQKGAVVVRGPSGAGKSTLVAAAWQAGFRLLGDESLLVARGDSDDLASSVRDLTLLSTAVELLELHGTEAAFSGGEEKRRIDLFRGSSPAHRRARRVAVLLLGPREPGPARLVSLPPEEFQREFARGEIPQERIGGDPDPVALDWSVSNGFRLDGAIDLKGAVAILRRLGGDPLEMSR